MSDLYERYVQSRSAAPDPPGLYKRYQQETTARLSERLRGARDPLGMITPKPMEDPVFSPEVRGAQSAVSLGYWPGSELAREVAPALAPGVREEVPVSDMVRYGAGYLAGTLPAAIATGAGTTAVLGRVAQASRTPTVVGRAASYLSRAPTAIRQVAAQNVAQGVGFSATTEPFRKLPEGVSRAESMALNAGVGSAADLALGTAAGVYGRAGLKAARGVAQVMRNTPVNVGAAVDEGIARRVRGTWGNPDYPSAAAPAPPIERGPVQRGEPPFWPDEGPPAAVSPDDPLSARFRALRRAEEMSPTPQPTREPGASVRGPDGGYGGPETAGPVETIEERIRRLTAEPAAVTPQRIIAPEPSMRVRSPEAQASADATLRALELERGVLPTPEPRQEFDVQTPPDRPATPRPGQPLGEEVADALRGDFGADLYPFREVWTPGARVSRSHPIAPSGPTAPEPTVRRVRRGKVTPEPTLQATPLAESLAAPESAIERQLRSLPARVRDPLSAVLATKTQAEFFTAASNLPRTTGEQGAMVSRILEQHRATLAPAATPSTRQMPPGWEPSAKITTPEERAAVDAQRQARIVRENGGVPDPDALARDFERRVAESPGAPARRAGEQPPGSPAWLPDEMRSRGLHPDRPLNDVDLSNQSVRDAVNADPTLTPEQRERVLRTGSPEAEPRSWLDANVKGALEEPMTPTTPPPARTGLEPVPAGERVSGIDGGDTTVVFSDGGKVNARYRISEAADLTPSHTPDNFAPNPRYPADVQGRQYQIDPAAQERVVEHATKHDPIRSGSQAPEVTSGPPLARPDGIVIAGNERTMAQQILSPAKRAEKVAALEAQARQFGIPEEQIAAIGQMQNPVLWREVADEAVDLTDRATLRDLNRRSDVSVGKAKDAISDASTRAARLRDAPKAVDYLAETLQEGQTLRDYLVTSDGRRFVDLLEESGVVDPREIAAFRKQGLLTKQGSEMIERTIEAAAIGDPDLVSVAGENAAPVMRQLEHAYPAIVQASTVEGWSLQSQLQEALRLNVELRGQPPEAGIKTVADLTGGGVGTQTSAFARADTQSGVKLATFLESANKAQTKLAFHEYAKQAHLANSHLGQNEMFDWTPPAPQDTFDRVFSVEGTPKPTPVKTPGVTPRGDAGFASWVVLRPMVTGGIVGFIGGATADDPDEVLRNTMVGIGIGAAIGIAPSIAAKYRTPGVPTFSDNLARTAQKYLLQAADFIAQRGGAAGKIISKDLNEINFRLSRRAAVQLQKAREFYKGLSRADQIIVSKIADSRPSQADAPQNLRTLGEQLRATVFDRDMQDMAVVGGQRMVGGKRVEIEGSGKAFPQKQNRMGQEAVHALRTIGVSDPRVQELGQAMVTEKIAPNLDDAMRRLGQWKAAMEGEVKPYGDLQQRGFNRYLESTRFQLPEAYVDWSPEGIEATIYRNAMTIEGMRQWGPGHGSLRVLLGQVEHDAGSDMAKMIDTFTRHEFGISGLEDRAEAGLLGIWNNFETTVRLGLSPLSAALQFGQRFTNTSHLPLSAQLKALRAYPPIINNWMRSALEMRAWAEGTGQVRGKSALADLHGAPGQDISEKALKLSGFLHEVKQNETYTAIASRFALEDDLAEVMKEYPKETSGLRQYLDILGGGGDVSKSKMFGGDATRGQLRAGAPVRRLQDAGITANNLADLVASGRRLTEGELAEAAYHLVNNAQFPLTMASKPIWWGTNPVLRLAFKFKTFGIRQTQYVYKNVVKEGVVNANWAPMAKFIGTSILMGEAYHIARDLVTGSDKSILLSAAKEGEVNDLGSRLFEDFYRSGGVGMLMDFQYGFTDWIGGPAGSTMKNVFETATHGVKAVGSGRPEQLPASVWEFMKDEAPSLRQAHGLVKRADEAIQGEGDFFHYQNMRASAFRHADAEDPFGERAAGAVGRVLTGSPDFEITANTIPLRSAGLAVQAGNLERAADHLAIILRHSDDQTSALRGIRTSLSGRGPLGGMNAEDEREFLRSMTPERRTEARRLQTLWERDSSRAVNMARRKARSAR